MSEVRVLINDFHCLTYIGELLCSFSVSEINCSHFSAFVLNWQVTEKYAEKDMSLTYCRVRKLC